MFTSPDDQFSVNSVIVEGGQEVMLVDAQLTKISAAKVLKEIKATKKPLSIIYITHDLATAYYISDRLLIMRQGRAVESGEARAVLDQPRHPYSKLLKR